MGLFDKVKGMYDDEEVINIRKHLKRGKSLQSSGELVSAIKEFETVIFYDANNADAYFATGQCYHNLARRENESAGGTIYFCAGIENLRNSIISFEKVTVLQPGMPDGYLNLGLAYDNFCELAKAEQCYRKTIKLDPTGMDGADACFNLAILRYMRLIGWAGLKNFPEYPNKKIDNDALEEVFQLAEKGISIGKKLIKHRTNYTQNLLQAHKQLGRWYMQHSLKNRALEHYRSVLNFDSKDQEAKERMAQINGKLS